MVKHTQTIRQLLPTNCLSVFDHFVGLALKGLMSLRLILFCISDCISESVLVVFLAFIFIFLLISLFIFVLQQ